MPNRKYVFDISDLQYKQVRLAWKVKLVRLLLWFAGSIVLTFIYISAFNSYFGSPKEKILSQDLESLKLRYSMLEMKLDDSRKIIDNLKLSDDKRYRPILSMDTIPESFRKPAYGGINRFIDLDGYINSDLLISVRSALEDIKSMANIQSELFKNDSVRAIEWKREMEYLPFISPVNPLISRGDGIKLREIHPVYGTPRWHFGQDFNAPYGTEVYATGAGKVITAGWIRNGFGNQIIIDHGYGYQTIYGHLSSIEVTEGTNVKRGDMIGLSGSSGISSGPHLHYQIMLNGNHQNPLNFFSDDLNGQEYLEMIKLLSSNSRYR